MEVDEDDEEGEDLCNCTFNLTYGAKILLNQTHPRLKRGQRYGLCGPNCSGKATLMRAINNEQVEGFPQKTEVKTVFDKLAETGAGVSVEDLKTKLGEFGFLETMFVLESTGDHCVSTILFVRTLSYIS